MAHFIIFTLISSLSVIPTPIRYSYVPVTGYVTHQQTSLSKQGIPAVNAINHQNWGQSSLAYINPYY